MVLDVTPGGWKGNSSDFSVGVTCVGNQYLASGSAKCGGSATNVPVGGSCDVLGGTLGLGPTSALKEVCCPDAPNPEMMIHLVLAGNPIVPKCNPCMTCKSSNPVAGSNSYLPRQWASELPVALPPPGDPSSSGGGASCSSQMPVRYASGEVMVYATDLMGAGFGFPWGHSRNFTSRLSYDMNLGNGFNWQVPSWSYLMRTTNDSVPTIAVMGSVGQTLYFTEATNFTYTPQFSVKSSLVLDRGAGLFRLTNQDGSVSTFHWQSGRLQSYTAPGGSNVRVASMTSDDNRVSSMERMYVSGGDTVVEELQYEYSLPYFANLEVLTLRRAVNGGDAVNVQRVVYTYYGYNDPHGATDDLQTVTTQVWQDDEWQNTGTTLYRYYLTLEGTSSSSSSSSSHLGGMGFSGGGQQSLLGGGSSSSSSSSSSRPVPPSPTRGVHLIKFIVEPASYARLAADPSVTDPLTASDAIVSLYADNYFQYDSSRRVTLEMVQGGSRAFGFAYAGSDFTDDYNHWKTKTTETLPDDSQKIVYCNYAGQPMLSVHQDGDDQWCDFYKYDASGNLILHAKPSAITGFDEQFADLLHEVGGHYQYLRDHDGFIEIFDIHAPTGWTASAKIKRGQLGTCIRLVDYEYTGFSPSSTSSSSSSSSSGTAGAQLTFFLTRAIVYPEDGCGCDCGSSSSSSSSSSSCSSGPCCSNDGTRQIITSFAYTFYLGTVQIKQLTTTLPAIPVEQNGSGVAATRKDYFDEYGNLTWKMDERGFITRMKYDIPTGAMTQRVDDVDTGIETDAPSGWTTPSGGGLNLYTDFEHDDQGRITQSLGPTHNIDINGSGTDIRRANWAVYQDADFETWSGQGYATGTSPSYTFTLINPVSITKMDAGGKVLEQISAVRTSTSGKLDPSDSFPQSTFVRWTTIQYTDCCFAASRRVYHTIPSSGEGSSGVNYDESDFGYDIMKRQNRNVTPGGTITYSVFDTRSNVVGVYVGTNDNGATDQDPTGGGAPGNNMVIVTGYEYDDGSDGGDGNLTETTQHVDASTARVTVFAYDWRDRQAAIDGEIDFYQVMCYDNLNRVLRVDRRDTTGNGNLIGRTETRYDDQSRVFRSLRYAVNPTTGAVGNSLSDNSWFDASGHPIKSQPSGSALFTKMVCDSLGRTAIAYTGYDLSETSYADAFTVTNDVILEQSESFYDAASNAVKSIVRQRYHNAPDTQKGALQDPATTPKARVTYSASWPDGAGRYQATADYGTNGGTALSRPDTVPARSNNVLVTSTDFDSAGNTVHTTDPAAMIIRFSYDAVGRETSRILNYIPGGSSSSSSSSSSGSGCDPSADRNVTTLTSYNADGNVSTLTAVNTSTGYQTTQYVYGTTLSDSGIASSLLKRKEIYPDSVDSDDVILFAYNRQHQLRQMTDQGGTERQYNFDLLGRQTQDRVTTVGTGVDGAVRRVETTFDVRGMKEHITSYDNATVSSGSVLNDCLFAYNTFGQLISEYQEHSGSVNTNTSPKVQYVYADGSSNTIRQTQLIYPSGRELTYSYGDEGGVDDACCRAASLIDDDGTTHLVDYSYLGRLTFVLADYTEPDTRYTLVGTAGGNDPDTGDIYHGLDRFGRVKDSYWYNYGSTSDTDRINYGYDRVGNRTYRENIVATAVAKQFDEFYSYDAIQRLKSMDRGTLNGTKTGLSSTTFDECWTLDESGNWRGFRQDDTGEGTWDLIQSRVANQVNELTTLAATTGPTWITPAYSRAGDMTTMPQPSDPTSSFSASYDAWNRLVKLVSGANTISEYVYDGVNRRILRRTYTGAILSELRHFYFTEPSQWQIVEERLGASADSANANRQYTWGTRHIDDCVLRDRDSNADGSLDERIYAILDANWNITGLLNPAGSVLERFAYNAYGTPLFLSAGWLVIADNKDWGYLYSGYHYDTASATYHVRRRILHPLLGVWLSRDPQDYVDGTNLYSYARSSPLTFMDYSGENCKCPGCSWTFEGWSFSASFVGGCSYARVTARCSKAELRTIKEYNCGGILFTKKIHCFCEAALTFLGGSLGLQAGIGGIGISGTIKGCNASDLSGNATGASASISIIIVGAEGGGDLGGGTYGGAGVSPGIDVGANVNYTGTWVRSSAEKCIEEALAPQEKLIVKNHGPCNTKELPQKPPQEVPNPHGNSAPGTGHVD